MSRKPLKDESISKFILFWVGIIALFAIVSRQFNISEDIFDIAATTWTLAVMPPIVAVILTRYGTIDVQKTSNLAFVFLGLFAVDFLIQFGIRKLLPFNSDHDRSILALVIMGTVRAIFGTLLFKALVDRDHK